MFSRIRLTSSVSMLQRAKLLSKLCSASAPARTRNLVSAVGAIRRESHDVDWNVCAVQRRYTSSDPSQHIPEVQYDDVKSMLKHPGKILVDVREPKELKETGWIPTSINIPVETIDKELGPKADAKSFCTKYGRAKPTAETDVIFYCRSGKRALKAARAAKALGYKNAKSYKGSWTEWAEREGIATKAKPKL